MFTGIIEDIGTVNAVKEEKGNLVLSIKSNLASRLKLNESVAHNGTCLSVIPVSKEIYSVMAVRETLNRTNLKSLAKGGKINLERSLKADGRIDGHFVLGHIDSKVKCTSIKKLAGSHVLTFTFQPNDRRYMVEKGSVALNGVSLTIAQLKQQQFSVAIIPYTFKNTIFQYVKPGDEVNIEYDVLGKYVLNATTKK